MSDWDKDRELKAVRDSNLPEEAKIIKKMFIVHFDLEHQGRVYASAKTEHGRLYARIVVQMRAEGEKSAEVAGRVADMDEAVHNAHLAYRLAEQMVSADKEMLKILHAELEAWRTRKADERAADTFQARTQS